MLHARNVGRAAGEGPQGGRAHGVQSQPGHEPGVLPQRDHHPVLRGAPQHHSQRARRRDQRVLRRNPRVGRGGRGPGGPLARPGDPAGAPRVGPHQRPRERQGDPPGGPGRRRGLPGRRLGHGPGDRHGADRDAPHDGTAVGGAAELLGGGAVPHVQRRRQLHLQRGHAPDDGEPGVRGRRAALQEVRLQGQARPHGAPRAPGRGRRRG
mmetsp:Transcript_64630/g.145788  ORF Transcript_64630/g.145788 Transcript_64630/m.145788 type:complete len:209 (-) Transcript_64630:271-897(-)